VVVGLVIHISINDLLAPDPGLQSIAIGVLVAAVVTTLVACAASRVLRAGAWVSVILLLGWLVWGAAAWAIEARSA